jgi:predicted RNA-binding protein with PUA-like domain
LPVARWLFKEEPDHYSYQSLERDGRTVWDGVTNRQAQKNLRQVREGDQVFYYGTGKVKSVIAEMVVVADPRPVPGTEPKEVVVEVAPVRRLARPVSLARIKEEASLANWELVRQPRLSVMPVTDEQWKKIEELSRSVD